MHLLYTGMYLALIAIIVICIVIRHWEPLIAAGPPELVYFFNPNCAFCEVFDPIWAEVEKQNTGCARLYKIDVTANPRYAPLRGVQIDHVPAIYLFPFGQYRSFEEYRGEKNVPSILKWLYKRLNGMGICNALIPEFPY